MISKKRPRDEAEAGTPAVDEGAATKRAKLLDVQVVPAATSVAEIRVTV